ncbi:MAG TPA: CPBP family intramembrane glutamic endopeptidase [Pyrinomonadaceae bacterium]|nr:CPBP family intramembrane glutamic endopeptidase [Pyrinomonadaceae bacterium]
MRETDEADFDSGAENPADERRAARSLAAWEIASVVTTTVVGEWLVFSVGEGDRLLVLVPVLFAFAYIFLSHRAWNERPRDLGWRLDNFFEAARMLALLVVVVAAFFVPFGYFNGSLNFTKWYGGQSILGVPVLGVLWGLMQQYVLQAFINRRAQIIWGRGWRSILLVGLLFGALHLPNPWLTAATFVAGLAWAAVYQRAPNLPALALSHGLMTWLLISTVPASALNGLRVGYKFFG